MQDKRKTATITQLYPKKKIKNIVFTHSSWIANLLKLSVAAAAIALVIQIGQQLQQAQSIEKELQQVTTQKEEAQKKHATLEQQVELLKDDDYIANLARSEYYLSKKGEIIFSFPDKKDKQ